jgi:hypothetical protein
VAHGKLCECYVIWLHQGFSHLNRVAVCRDISVGIATGYGLDGPGIESRWGPDFSHLSRPAMGPTQPPVQSLPDLSRE